MSLKSILLAGCTISLPTSLLAQTTPVAPPIASQVPAITDADAETVVVTAQRGKNSVAGGAVPETTLAPAEIRALGASNVAEILASLGPRAGSGRGRGDGQPVVLLNGRRISGFAEVRNIPSEAILRVEVFPEATALQYGYSADQRVVNFILRPRFRAVTLEGSLGLSADGDRSEDGPEINYLRITDKGRIGANFEVSKSNAVTEAQRGIVATAGLADSAFRTVLPETFTGAGNVTYARGVGPTMGATFDARINTTQFESLLGLRALGSSEPALRRESTTTNTRLAATLDGATKGWQWTATGSYDNVDTQTTTQIVVGPTQTAQSQSGVLEFVANSSGPLFKLPGGIVRGAASTAYVARDIDSQSVRAGVATLTSLSRKGTTSSLSLTLPLTSRREAFGAALGDLSVTANGRIINLSDFGASQQSGVGISWSPIADLRFSANADNAQTSPTVQQLGNPVVSTPGSSVFDYATGQTVLVTRTSGGNFNLRPESRNDVTFAVNYAPTKVEGLEITVSWARNKSQNQVGSLNGLTPNLEAAFGDRFTRVNGTLVAIDQRPINFAASQNEIVRYGVSYGRSFGTPIAPPSGAGRPNSDRSSSDRPAGTRPTGQRPGGFGGGGGFGGFGGGPPGGPPGRWSLSIFHTIRLEDSVTLATGSVALDLLDGDAIDDNGGARRHLIEVEGGWAYRGIGFRANSSWRSGTKIANGTSDLNFDDIFNLNLRAFISFDARREMIAKGPWLRRSRLIVRVDNLTDSFQRVTDSAGNTPQAFQRGYIAPRGRFVEVSWRKQF